MGRSDDEDDEKAAVAGLFISRPDDHQAARERPAGGRSFEPETLFLSQSSRRRYEEAQSDLKAERRVVRAV